MLAEGILLGRCDLETADNEDAARLETDAEGMASVITIP